jgi:hypothetical protein
MANGFDRRGAIVGVALLLLLVLCWGAWTALGTLSVKVDLPPVAGPAPR